MTCHCSGLEISARADLEAPISREHLMSASLIHRGAIAVIGNDQHLQYISIPLDVSEPAQQLVVDI